jgi:hypothetical protein
MIFVRDIGEPFSNQRHARLVPLLTGPRRAHIGVASPPDVESIADLKLEFIRLGFAA